ncbi:MAG TPA: FHA domain-containing protein, partial [Planctomycetaceae bacterium]|nr:FHA domain-containing protein [Planctomycetaceae bacterium]
MMFGQLVPCGGGKPIPLAKARQVLRSRRSKEEPDQLDDHAELLFEDGIWSVRRLAEEVTLRINDRACGEGRLKPNDVLTVGRHRYRIIYVAPASADALPVALAEPAPLPPVTPRPLPTLPLLGVLVPCGGGPPVMLRKMKVVIGRSAACDVVLPQKIVSSRHCELQLLLGHWQVSDLDSHNGTFVDGVPFRQKWLFPGDVLGVATNRYRVEYQPRGERPLTKDDDIPVLSRRSLMGSVGLTEGKLDKMLRAAPGSDEPARPRWEIDEE